MTVLIHPTRATRDLRYIGVRKGERMYHVLSDHAGPPGTAELLAFVRQCGLRPEWIQGPGTYREHFDTHGEYAECLMRHGARPATNREGGLLLRAKREGERPGGER
jgi:hypothetical protein